MAEQIMAGSGSAVEEMYKSLWHFGFLFVGRIGPDCAEEAYHNLNIDLVGALKMCALRGAGALFACAVAIARGMVPWHIGESIRGRQNRDVRNVWLTCDASESPEQRVLRLARVAIARQVLAEVAPRNREMLIRFYLDRESEEEIKAALGMGNDQFRLAKTWAKVRYGELLQQSMNRAPDRKCVQSPLDQGAPPTVQKNVPCCFGAREK